MIIDSDWFKLIFCRKSRKQFNFFSAPLLHFYQSRLCLYFKYACIIAENSAPRGKFCLVENSLYRCLFFQTATENVRCCSPVSFACVEIGRFWNLQHPKFINHNGTKMVDVWNVNKLTEARTKMEVGELQTKAAQ